MSVSCSSNAWIAVFFIFGSMIRFMIDRKKVALNGDEWVKTCQRDLSMYNTTYKAVQTQLYSLSESEYIGWAILSRAQWPTSRQCHWRVDLGGRQTIGSPFRMGNLIEESESKLNVVCKETLLSRQTTV